MKLFKRISIFVILSLVICMAFTAVCLAAEASGGTIGEASNKLDMDMKPESFGERAELALQGTVTGMVMIFSVLGLLAIIMTLSKVIFYDIPNKKKEKAKKKSAPAPTVAPVTEETVSETVETETPTPTPVNETADDGEIVAVITAAVAAMIESSEYKNEFVGGFRVVSFKRSTSNAWNKK